ncbi:hypothetical protein [Halovenus marina]|uniref:hypothetical protein n=1 Tax=Halovenus marina TaxID=3396621 RepID=UPI003F55375B
MVEVHAEIELDTMSVKILQVLDEHDGVATSTEIKNVLGHDSTRLINYRKYEYLEPAGLIDTSQTEGERSGGRPTQEWSLTEKGLELVDEIDEETGEPRGLADRVERVEDRLGALQETLSELEEQGVNSDSEAGENDQILSLIESVNNLQQRVGEVESRVESIESYPVFDEEMQGTLDAAITMSAVSKQLLAEEHGEERVADLFAEKEEDLHTFR